MSNPNAHTEWSYVHDDYDIVYCLGRRVDSDVYEMVATYYRTDPEYATKQTLDGGTFYRRFVYQGLPEERERLAQIERPEVAGRLLAHTAVTQTGIFLNVNTLTPSLPAYRSVSAWLDIEHPKARAFQQALKTASTALSGVGVSLDGLFLYGGASFGAVNNTDKVVDDVDFAFHSANLAELRGAVDELQSSYSWNDIDPFGRLPKERQLLKAKRWATSQIRLNVPYPLSIDLKVARLDEDSSLWDMRPEHTDRERFIDVVRVVDDSEALCTSPALLCEDRSGNLRVVLMEGYQYIGCAVAGDVVGIVGNAYRDSKVIVVTQSGLDGITPDFRNVPIS